MNCGFLSNIVSGNNLEHITGLSKAWERPGNSLKHIQGHKSSPISGWVHQPQNNCRPQLKNTEPGNYLGYIFGLSSGMVNLGKWPQFRSGAWKKPETVWNMSSTIPRALCGWSASAEDWSWAFPVTHTISTLINVPGRLINLEQKSPQDSPY